MSPADAEVIRRPDIREILLAALTEAFRQGSQGAAHDVVLLGRPWGFALTGIQPEVYLWQGEDDTLVPPAMGRYLAGADPALPGHVPARRGTSADHQADDRPCRRAGYPAGLSCQQSPRRWLAACGAR